MKNLLIVMMLCAILLGCGESKEKKENTALKAEVEKLKAENDALKAGDAKLKSSISEFNKFLKEVEANLASIDENKTMLAEINKEGTNTKDTKALINARVTKIKELMENSKLKILSLDKSLAKLRKESGDKSDEIMAFDRQVKGLTRDLMQRDQQIEELDDELEEAEELYNLKIAESQELKSIINRAFMIMGNAKELKEKGIVDKEGGFIGLGRVKVLNANASDTLFNRIGKEETNEVQLGVKSAKLISNHPDGSYSFVEADGKVSKLVIADKQQFWKDGNYLVIETKK